MPEEITGPVETLTLFGKTVREYLIKFDKTGKCLSIQSQADLIAHIHNDHITDVIFYIHGWNNDYPTAKTRYEEFLAGVSSMAERQPGHLPSGFTLVFVGVIWPSTAFVWPSEAAPDIAATGDDEAFDDVLSLLADGDAEHLRASLRDRAALDAGDFARFATALAANLPPPDASEPDANPVAAEDAIAVWGELARVKGNPKSDGGFGGFGGATMPVSPNEPLSAGGLFFDPRILLRAATVMQMKDRAGVVGAAGAANMLGQLLNTKARVHLVGHSYGAKVVSTALVHQTSGKKAQSMLLLQPAVNHLAFAPNARDGQPGAFHEAFDRLQRPLLATYSFHDFPLHAIFHLILRRKADLGELQAAAEGISRYAALGGYGPQEYLSEKVILHDLPQVGVKLPNAANSVRMIGLNGKIGIGGHSDVNNDYIYWTFLTQLG